MGNKKYSAHRIVVSVLFGIFTSVSSLLIILAHIGYVEVAALEGFSAAKGVSVDNTIVAFVATTVMIASLTAQFLTVYFSMKPRIEPSDVVYPVIGFASQLGIGYLGLLFLPLPSAWENIIGVPIYAGIAAISLHIFLYLIGRNKTIQTLIDKKGNKSNVVKSLELEHGILQSSLSWIVSLSSLFVIGGVVAVVFNRDEYIPATVHEVILRNVVTLAVVAIIGLWFGVVMQLFGQMRWIRERIEEIEVVESKEKTLQPSSP